MELAPSPIGKCRATGNLAEVSSAELAHLELLTVFENDCTLLGAFAVDLLHELQIHNAGAVNAQECGRVELLAQGRNRLSYQVRLLANVQTGIVVASLNPYD